MSINTLHKGDNGDDDDNNDNNNSGACYTPNRPLALDLVTVKSGKSKNN